MKFVKLMFGNYCEAAPQLGGFHTTKNDFIILSQVNEISLTVNKFH